MVLARLFREQGKYADAESHYRQALDEAIKGNGQEHSRVATFSHYFAQFYAAQSKYEQAEPLERRAIAIFENEEMLKPDNWFKYRSLGTLAMIYAGEGREKEAESLYKESAEHLERLLGPDHPETANSLSGLAKLYMTQKRYSEAEPLVRRALAIREKSFDPEHPDVAVSLNDLGKLYREQDKYDEAEKYFRQAIAILEKRKPNHPDLAETLDNYALLLRKTNRVVEAAGLKTRAKEIRDRLTLPRKKCEESAASAQR
jgi:tetratricopeptide (TPR) repeat protein